MRSLTPAEIARLEARCEAKEPAASYALLRSSNTRAAKPLVFASMEALARRIIAERGGFGLDGDRATLFAFAGRPGKAVVSLWAVDHDTGGRQRWIGYAWFPGGDRRELTAALHALEAPAEPHARAA